MKANKFGKENYNARININYSGKKPDIRFSYPDKKTQEDGTMFIYIFAIVFLLFNIIFLSVEIGMDLTLESYVYEDSTAVKIGKCAINNTNYSEEFNKTNFYWECQSVYKNTYDSYDLLGDFFSYKNTLIMILLFPYLLSLLIYLPFKKDWNKLYPKTNGFMASKKLRTFKPKDIIKRDGKIFVELPVFKNIVLDFKSKGDFSKYLNEIDIREHKFYYFRKKTVKVGKKKKKFRKYNDFLWYARWYFTQVPKQGELKIIYK